MENSFVSNYHPEKVQFWRALVDAHMQSGQTIKAFCGERKLPRSNFDRWRQILAAKPTNVTLLLPNAWAKLHPTGAHDSKSTTRDFTERYRLGDRRQHGPGVRTADARGLRRPSFERPASSRAPTRDP